MLRDFLGPGCPVLFPLELPIVFDLFCTGAVKCVTVPLVFGRSRLPNVVVWSWSMGWARLDAGACWCPFGAGCWGSLGL